jgi:hypothetical protein
MKMKYIRFAFLALAVVLVGSCTEKFEEMNVDPNNPTTVPATNILASVLWVHADGNHDEWSLGNEHGSYAGHISKIQYIDEARYQFRESIVNNRWNRFYLLLSDVQQIYNQASEDQDDNMMAVALTMKSFLSEMIVSEWGDVPFSKAIKGTEGELLPVYDSQSAIYDGILADLKAAADLFDAAAAGPGEGDLLFGGDVSGWQKWCNSLRLRTAIRISNVDQAKASGVIAEVLGSPANYPIMSSVSDMAALQWTTSSPYREPFWENKNLGGRDDHGVASYIIDEMLALNDPRVGRIAEPAVSDGQYRGIVPGLHPDNEGFDLNSISRIGEMFQDRADGYTYFQRYSEVLFIIAEAVHRGLATYSMTAQEAYEAAITASFEEMELTTAEAATYYAQASVAYSADAAGLNKIYMQKWLALFKSHEAWAEVRRTDVPVMPMAPGSVFPGHNRTPFRYPYAQDEKNLNSANVTAASAGVVDHFWGEQLWWDTRTGVN